MRIKFFLVAAIILVVSAAGCSQIHTHSFGEISVTEPDCTTEGFGYRICNLCDEVEYTDTVPALGHSFSEWYDDIRYEERVARCTVCGVTDADGEYTPPDSIPRLYIEGKPGAAVIPVRVKYAVGDVSVDFYGLVSRDANISNPFYNDNFQKIDYDIEFFADEAFTVPYPVTFKEAYGSHSVYSLKAEYADKTSVRNLAASELWYEVTASRTSLNEGLGALPFLGADRGFPVLFYTNGNFKGIYNLCLPNDEELFGLTNEMNQALVYSYTDFGSFDFRYPLSQTDFVPCTVIYPDNEEAEGAAAEKFTSFMEFVYTSSDEEFSAHIGEMLDVEAAIDYLVTMYSFGADANAIDFCNWVTYDGVKWIPSMYNLTSTFGLTPDGGRVTPDESVAPYFDDGILYSGTESALWDKLCRCFTEQIRARYLALRSTIFTGEKIHDVFSGYISMISEDVYTAELDEYSQKKLLDGSFSADEIAAWFSQKADILDNVFGL